MRINSVVFLAILIIIVCSCKKDSNSNNTTGTYCQLSKKIESTSGYSDTSYYTYNLFNELIKISSNHSSFIDSISYNALGKIDSINTFQNNILTNTTHFYYSNNKLTIVDGTWAGFIILNYPSGSLQPNSISSTLFFQEFGVNSITDIAWSNGNIVSATFNYGSNMNWEVSVLSDTKKNYKRFDTPISVEDFIYFFNKNNIISISLVNEETDGYNIFPAGTKILDQTYTYTSNSEANTITEHPGYFNSHSKITTCTYNCQ